MWAWRSNLRKNLWQPYPEWSLQHLFQMKLQKLSALRVHVAGSAGLTTIALGECINAFSSLRSFSACVTERNRNISSAFCEKIPWTIVHSHHIDLTLKPVNLKLKMVWMKYNSPKKYLDTLFILQFSECFCIK